MTGAGDGVTTVEIEILLASTRVDPDALATFSGDRHFLVRSQLKLVLIGHGFVPTSFKPVVSSRPNIKFMFCTAWPAAPLTRLSMAEQTTICFPRAADRKRNRLNS